MIVPGGTEPLVFVLFDKTGVCKFPSVTIPSVSSEITRHPLIFRHNGWLQVISSQAEYALQILYTENNITFCKIISENLHE